MSPTVKTTYSRHEVREVREAFREWTWGDQALEPDGRVSVLYQAHPGQQMRGYLCRCQHGWFWAADAAELQRKAKTETPYSWNAAIRDLGGDGMRVPAEQELEMGGFRVTVDDEPELEDMEQAVDEAKEQIDKGFRALDVSDHQDASARFLASIAISLYDLVGLHKKYDIDNLRVEVDPGPAGQTVAQIQEQLDKMADEPEGKSAPGTPGSEDFPYAR